MKQTKVVQPACLILERLAGETFPLVQYDFVDLVYTLLEMAASRWVCWRTARMRARVPLLFGSFCELDVSGL